MQLDVLCEVHDRVELDRAVDLGFTVIGVNSRNLHTMQVEPQTLFDLAQGLPATPSMLPRAASATPRRSLIYAARDTTPFSSASR